MRKVYLSRSQSKFWSADMPVGDPTGGVAYGEKNDPVTALAAATIGSSLIGANASSSAANTQAASASQAAQVQQNMFNTTQKNLQPYMQQGATSLSQLGGMMNTDPGGMLHQFNAQDLQSNLSPNYNWQLGQGIGQNTNAAAATGGLVGGNALSGLNSYAQNFAGNAYQNAFNNYQTSQGNIYNRLSNLANLGQSAAANTAQAGGNAATGMGNAYMAAGSANSAGTMGMANALGGGINTLGMMNMMGTRGGYNPSFGNALLSSGI